MTEQVREATPLSAAELYDIPVTARHAREMGKRALIDGFMVMELTASPCEELRQEMRSRVVEQDDAIDTIIEALERAPVRKSDDKRPIANLAFLGPTGVGKSELAKTLADLMGYGEDGSLIKIDCSSYSNGHEVLTLTGSPPSYVGKEQEPLFSKQRIESGKKVLLFDEVEKGSEKLYDLMLQIMGDGELTLNNGEVVCFRETIIVMTSNLGAKEMSAELSPFSLGFGTKKGLADKKQLDRVATDAFTDFFKPEFINRIHKMPVFHSLTRDGLRHVLEVKMEELNDEYEDEFGARITLTDATRQHLVEIAQKEPHLGARPLVRALEENVQTVFGRYVGGNHIPEGTHVRVYHRDELPEEYRPEGSEPLIFTAKRDAALRKYRPPLEITATSYPTFVRAEEASEHQE
jgi:ATP-dependent Clp protease ATP-binding subunit ClpA